MFWTGHSDRMPNINSGQWLRPKDKYLSLIRVFFVQESQSKRQLLNSARADSRRASVGSANVTVAKIADGGGTKLSRNP